MTSLTRAPRIPLDKSINVAVDPGQAESDIASWSAPPSSNRWRKFGTVAALGAVSLVTLGKLGQHVFGNHWKATWGSVEQPRFTISSSATLSPISTFREEAQSFREALLKEQEAVLQLLSDYSMGSSERRKAATALYTRLFGLPIKPGESPAVVVPRAARDSAVPDKPVEVYSRELVEQLIGAPLPQECTIKVGEIPLSGIGGFANILTSNVTVEPTTIFPTERENYFQMVGTAAHEVGHQIFRYAEQRYLGWTPWEGASYKTTVREEAVAVLFRVIAGAQLSDPDDRFSVSGNFHGLAEKYFEGEKDYGLNEGAALADAALTLYPDPRHAFSELSSAEPLDPMLREIMKQNRELHHEVLKLMEKREALREKLQKSMDE